MTKPIYYHRKFKKAYKKRIQSHKKLVQKVKDRIQIFLHERTNPLICDHQLEGKLSQYRSFSISGDFRIVYMELPDRFEFLDIGTHAQVYGM